MNDSQTSYRLLSEESNSKVLTAEMSEDKIQDYRNHNTTAWIIAAVGCSIGYGFYNLFYGIIADRGVWARVISNLASLLICIAQFGCYSFSYKKKTGSASLWITPYFKSDGKCDCNKIGTLAIIMVCMTIEGVSWGIMLQYAEKANVN